MRCGSRGLSSRSKTTMKHAATCPSLVLALLFTTACGGASPDAEIASLMPKDCVAVVRIASVDQLVKNMRHAAIAVGEDPKSVDADTLLKQLEGVGGKTALIDRSRPIAIAVSMPGDTPSPVLLIPATDAKAYAASLPPMGAPPVVSGGYVVLALGAKYEKAHNPQALVNNLPSGVLAIRADAEQLVTMLGSEISANLRTVEAQMARELTSSGSGLDGKAMAEAFVGVARSVLGAAKTLELSLDYRDGQLDAFAALTVKPGSELDGWGAEPVDLKSLTGRLSGKGSFEVLMAADWGKLWPRLAAIAQPALDIYPPQMRELLRPYFADFEQLYRALGPIVAAEGDVFGSKGMSFLMHLAPPDATALQRQFEAILAHESLAKMGISSGPAKAVEADGASIRDYEMKIDLDKFATLSGLPAERDSTATALHAMFGGGNLLMRLANKGGRSVLAIGAQPNLAATLASLDGKGGNWSKSVQAVQARLGDCNPLVVERIDFAAMMSGMSQVAAAVGGPALPPVPAGQSADFVIAAGIHKNEWRGQLSIDVTGFAKVMKAMMPR